MIVCRQRGNSIGTTPCGVLYDICAQRYTHTDLMYMYFLHMFVTSAFLIVLGIVWATDKL